MALPSLYFFQSARPEGGPRPPPCGPNRGTAGVTHHRGRHRRRAPTVAIGTILEVAPRQGVRLDRRRLDRRGRRSPGLPCRYRPRPERSPRGRWRASPAQTGTDETHQIQEKCTEIPKPGTRTVPGAPSGGFGTTSRRLEATPPPLVASTGAEPRAVRTCGAPIPARMQTAREPCHDHRPSRRIRTRCFSLFASKRTSNAADTSGRRGGPCPVVHLTGAVQHKPAAHASAGNGCGCRRSADRPARDRGRIQ